MNKNEKLSEIRKLLYEKMPNDSIFILSDGCEIDKKDENEYQLSEIIEEGKVYIKSKSTYITFHQKKYQFKEVN